MPTLKTLGRDTEAMMGTVPRVAAFLLAVGGCAHAEPPRAGAAGPTAPEAPGAPQAPLLLRDHPLVGRIFAAQQRRFIERDELLAALLPARFVLLGEKHDNPEAHALQAWALDGIVARGRRPAVIFEMIRRDQQALVDEVVAGHPTDPAPLGDALGWDASGWPSFAWYAPLFAAALRHHLPIVGGDLSIADLAQLRRGELEGLGETDRRRFGRDLEPSRTVRAALVAELREDHCGLADEAMLRRMVIVQWARDSQLATALIAAARAADGAVLIAGNGHARRDRGVPLHLAHLLTTDGGAAAAPAAPAPDANEGARSVGFLEVEAGVTDPLPYLEEGPEGPAFDYVYFTARVDAGDPCANMRQVQ